MKTARTGDAESDFPADHIVSHNKTQITHLGRTA